MKKRNRGFSIVEVMITCVILCMFMAVGCNVMVSSLRGFRSSDATFNSRMNVMVAMSHLKSKIRGAAYVKIKDPGPKRGTSVKLFDIEGNLINYTDAWIEIEYLREVKNDRRKVA